MKTDLNELRWTPNTSCPSSFVLHTISAPSGGPRRPVVGFICSSLRFQFPRNILWPLCWNIRCLNAERVAPPGESLERIKAQLKFGWRNELLRITSSTGGAGVSATSWVYLVDRFSETRRRNHRAAQRWVISESRSSYTTTQSPDSSSCDLTDVWWDVYNFIYAGISVCVL